jgi:hypothetical protein
MNSTLLGLVFRYLSAEFDVKRSQASRCGHMQLERITVVVCSMHAVFLPRPRTFLDAPFVLPVGVQVGVPVVFQLVFQ